MSARRGLAFFALALSALALPFDAALPMIPFGRPPGLDFHNLYSFHHCAIRNAPYSRDDGGAVCGDVEKRAMKYPPLLYWSFAWTRPLPYRAALALWVAFVLVASSLALWRWIQPECRRDPIVLLLVALLLAQYPMIFSFDRGNSDVLPLVLWTAMFAAFRRRRDLLAGAFAGLAVATKVYPLFAVAVIVPFVWRAGLRRAFRFALGCAAAAGAALLVFARDTLQYVHILRAFAAERPQPSLFAHGTPSFFPPTFAGALIALLLGSWVVVAWRAAEADASVVFAGSLAVSTFQAATSYDYNLITAYPLLAVLFSRMRRDDSRSAALTAILLLLTITVPRALFLGWPKTHLVAEMAALAAAALAQLTTTAFRGS